MDDKEIELLIEKKVADAKLEVTEKELNHFKWFAGVALTVFGIIFPYIISDQASKRVDAAVKEMRDEISKTSNNMRADSLARADSMERVIQSYKGDLRDEMNNQSRELANNATRVDNAIKEMHQQFKELAGNQLKKPVLECLSGGTSLEGHIFKISPTHENIVINVKNTGDATAKSIRLRLYTNISPESHNIEGDNTQWGFLYNSDDPKYKYAFETKPFSLDPKDDLIVDLNLVLSTYPGLKSGNYPILLKLYYEQSEPRKFWATINISGL